MVRGSTPLYSTKVPKMLSQTGGKPNKRKHFIFFLHKAEAENKGYKIGLSTHYKTQPYE